MQHSAAIEIIAERFAKKWGKHKVFIEKRNIFPKLSLIPDIAIDTNHGSEWIFVEVGGTNANKIKQYRDVPEIKKVLWYDNVTLQLVGIWNFTAQFQLALFDDNPRIISLREMERAKKKIEDEIELLKGAKYQISVDIQKIKADYTLMHLVRDERCRVLCPVCLEPVPIKDSVGLHRQGGYEILVCESCIKGWDYDCIGTKKHIISKLWQAFTRVASNYNCGIFAAHFDEIFENGIDATYDYSTRKKKVEV